MPCLLMDQLLLTFLWLMHLRCITRKIFIKGPVNVSIFLRNDGPSHLSRVTSSIAENRSK